MKRTLLPIAIIALALLFTGCGQTPPVAINWAENAKPELDKKIVTIEGYAHVPDMINGSGAIQLQQRKGSRAHGIRVAPNIGSGNNQMQALPSQYQNADLKFKTDKGESCGFNDYVRITGECVYQSYEKSYFIKNITKIEKATPPSEDYASLGATPLTTDKMKDLDDKLVVVEGNIIVPQVFMDENGVAKLQFSSDKLSAPVSLNIYYTVDEGANSALLLGEEATAEDVVVFDNNKQEIDLSKKVRIYGTWRQPEGSSDAPYLAVEQITVL
ncbi:MAG: hypothetical protein U0V74_08140 [Chitinophagales bacterium]